MAYFQLLQDEWLAHQCQMLQHYFALFTSDVIVYLNPRYHPVLILPTLEAIERVIFTSPRLCFMVMHFACFERVLSGLHYELDLVLKQLLKYPFFSLEVWIVIHLGEENFEPLVYQKEQDSRPSLHRNYFTWTEPSIKPNHKCVPVPYFVLCVDYYLLKAFIDRIFVEWTFYVVTLLNGLPITLSTDI